MSLHIDGIGSVCPYTYQITPKQGLDPEKLDRIANLYIQVFGGEPWNEHQKCPQGHKYGRAFSHLQVCREPDCQQLLSPYYNFATLKQTILQEISSTNGLLCTYESDEGRVVGAGWGFTFTLEEFTSIKYKTDKMKSRITTLLMEKNDGAPAFYLSEMMVDDDARQRGVATKIARVLVNHAHSIPQNVFLRTFEGSPMDRLASNLNLKKILFEGQDLEHRNRVVLLG